MGIQLEAQVIVFLQSLLVGAALGLLFDAFRISRIAFRTPSAVVFAEDVLYFFIAALVTFLFCLTTIDGSLRVFLIIGEVIGGTLYFCTVGRLVMSVSKKIIEIIKSILRFLLKWIFRPICMLIYHIITFILRPFKFLSKYFKKKHQNAKFRLKVMRKVLYNQLIGYFKTRKAVKKPRGRKDDKKEKDRT